MEILFGSLARIPHLILTHSSKLQPEFAIRERQQSAYTKYCLKYSTVFLGRGNKNVKGAFGKVAHFLRREFRTSTKVDFSLELLLSETSVEENEEIIYSTSSYIYIVRQRIIFKLDTSETAPEVRESLSNL